MGVRNREEMGALVAALPVPMLDLLERLAEGLAGQADGDFAAAIQQRLADLRAARG